MARITTVTLPKSFGSGVHVVRDSKNRYYWNYSQYSLARFRRALSGECWRALCGPSFTVYVKKES